MANATAPVTPDLAKLPSFDPNAFVIPDDELDVVDPDTAMNAMYRGEHDLMFKFVHALASLDDWTLATAEEIKSLGIAKQRGKTLQQVAVMARRGNEDSSVTVRVYAHAPQMQANNCPRVDLPFDPTAAPFNLRLVKPWN